MSETASALLSAFDEQVPTDRELVLLEVATAPPPKPLTRTLHTLADLEDEEILVQINDREPTGLYPKLDERGVSYATIERDESVLTALWKP
jgi:hypothetical protein